ncbi:MAG: cupin domain-containing protein [Actinomycetota bacterium]
MAEDKPYFAPAYEYEVDPEFPSSYVSLEQDVPSLPVEPGIVVRPVIGKRLNMSFIHFEPRAVAPVHQHGEEQLGTVLEGSLEFELAGEKRVLRNGDAYVIPPNVPHGGSTGDEGCVTLDVFSPPRAGLRELVEKAGMPPEAEA